MDSINTSSEVSISSVQIKEEPLDSEPEPEDFINPAENVKVELEEEDGVKLETNATIDPLANVQAHYTVEASSSEPGCSRKRPAPTTSGQADDDGMGVITTEGNDYVRLDFVPLTEDLLSVRKGRLALQMTRKYICNICPYTTSYKRSITDHQEKHLGQYGCKRCDYVGINRSDLLIHLKTEHDSRPFNCDRCSYGSEFKSRLLRHIQETHSTTKPFLCRLCDFKATSHKNVVLHFRAKHPESNPFQCDACDQSFKTFDSMRRHKRLNHDTKASFCDLCDYSCKDKYYLLMHKQKKHLNTIIDKVNSDMLI